MTTRNNVTTLIRAASYIKPILIGGGIALIVIALFIFGVEGRPEWGTYWRIRPLIITPLAGAAGGALFYFLSQLGSRGGWIRIVATILGIIAYVVALWLGTVLGLAGTLWN